MMSRVFPDPRHWQAEDWSRCQAYMPHVRSCLDLIAQYELLSPEVAQLLLRAGSFHAEQAHLKEAERLTQQALTISEQLFGLNHLDVAHGLEQLAWIYFMQRGEKSKEAELLYQRAIVLYDQAFGSTNPEVAECYNELAVLYGSQGKYEQAEKIFLYQGKYEQAEQLGQHSLAIYRGVSAHQLMIGSGLGILGLVYREQGEYERAESLLRQVLNSQERDMPSNTAIWSRTSIPSPCSTRIKENMRWQNTITSVLWCSFSRVGVPTISSK